MSEPIMPLDPQALLDLLPDAGSAMTGSGMTLAEALEGDAVYAPADVSETPVGPVPRRVRTLTNSPGCAPAGEPSARGETSPIRQPRRVRTDAWASPAPTSWGRSRHASRAASVDKPKVRRVEPARAGGRRGRPVRSVATTPSSDWALPF